MTESILIVEDDHMKQNLLKDIFDCCGYESVAIVDTLGKAFKLVNITFTKVYIDFYLGDECGILFYNKYRDNFPNVEVIMYSGEKNGVPIEYQCFVMDFNDLLKKLACMLSLANRSKRTMSDIDTVERVSALLEWKINHELSDREFRDDVKEKFNSIEKFTARAGKFIDNSKYIVALIILAYLVLPNEGIIKLIRVIFQLWK